SFKEQEQILLQIKVAREKRQESAKSERPKSSTSTRVRIPAAIRPPSGPHAPVRFAPSANSSTGAVIFVLGALSLLAAFGALYYFVGGQDAVEVARNPSPPPAPPEPAPVIKVYKPEAPAVSPKEETAKAALEKARDSVKANATIEQQITLFTKAVQESNGTAVLPAARRELEEAQGRMK